MPDSTTDYIQALMDTPEKDFRPITELQPWFASEHQGSSDLFMVKAFIEYFDEYFSVQATGMNSGAGGNFETL